MPDLLSIVATVAFFAIAILYIHACEILTRGRKPVPHA
jgi:hypothetical protein